MLLERGRSKQKGMLIFWCTASLGTFPALASHSLICPGIAHLPLTLNLCYPGSACSSPAVRQSRTRSVNTPMCGAARLKTAVLGLSPRLTLAMMTALSAACISHQLSLLTATRNTKLNTPSLLSCRKGQVPFYSIFWFTLSFLCRVCYSLLHGAAQIPSRQRPKLCLCSYFYWLDISVDYCTVVSTIAPDLHQPKRDQSLAQCLQSLLKLVSQRNTSIKSCFEGTERRGRSPGAGLCRSRQCMKGALLEPLSSASSFTR